MSAVNAALRQVKNEEVEYQPGYFVWQMEAEVRDIIEAAARSNLADASDADLLGELVRRGVLQPEHNVKYDDGGLLVDIRLVSDWNAAEPGGESE